MFSGVSMEGSEDTMNNDCYSQDYCRLEHGFLECYVTQCHLFHMMLRNKSCSCYIVNFTVNI